jgi:hypothetical protein
MPAIVLAGFRHLVDADSAIAAGINGLFVKCIAHRGIGKTVKKALDKHSSVAAFDW